MGWGIREGQVYGFGGYRDGDCAGLVRCFRQKGDEP